MANSSDVPNAAAFLAMALPWPDPTNPSDKFYVNIHRRAEFTGRDGKHIKAYVGKACTSVQEAANYVAWANTLNTDIYVCMSGQSQAKEKLNASGRRTFQAVRSADNALWFKGLWIDVDVKPSDPSHGYADSREAVSEFTRIRKHVGMPLPTVLVMSGSGGFHVHWCFSERVASDRWQAAAGRLVAAILAAGFRGDTGCTTDGARLLRVPDTGNYKGVVAGTGPRQPVRTLTQSGNSYTPEFLEGILAPFEPAVSSSSTRTASFGALGPKPSWIQGLTPDAALGAGIEKKDISVPAAKLAEACPFAARSLATGGKDNNNPLWHTTTRMSMWLDEGRNAAHWMASAHPGYDQASTDELYDRVAADRLHRNFGWPRCATIHANGAPECKVCPHLVGAQSPFTYAGLKPDEVTSFVQTPPPLPAGALSNLPPGYSYGPHGVINQDCVDDDGKSYKVPVTHFALLDAWIQDRPAALNFTANIAGELGQPDVYMRQIKLSLDHLHEPAALGKDLAKQQLVVPHSGLLKFREFIMSWQTLLRADRENLVESAPYGWYRNKDGQIAGFIYAKQIHNTGSPRPASNPDRALEKMYQPTGTLDPWILAAKMITAQSRPELNAILASAFGAPLVALVGQTGLLMSTYSPESGIGKSTCLRVTQAVWGHPVRAVQSLSDTQNSVLKKIGDIKNLPMYWDELKSETDVAKFVHLAFQLAQGKEKSRMSSDTTYREVGTWETMLVCTSNDSLMGHIVHASKSTNAGLMRVFEYVIPPGVQGQIDPSQAQLITASLNDNFGSAGLKYAQFLGSNHKQVQKEVTDKLAELEKLLRVHSEERFWLAIMTVIIMGAKYANLLGLTQINEGALQAFMFDTFKAMRNERIDQPVDLSVAPVLCGHVARYLNAQRERGTLITNIIWTRPGRPAVHPTAGGVQLFSDPTIRMQELVVHLAGTPVAAGSVQVDLGKARFAKEPFVRWLEENELSDRIILNQLRNNYGVVETRGRLGAGTKWITQQEVVLDFDFNHPGFKGLLSAV